MNKEFLRKQFIMLSVPAGLAPIPCNPKQLEKSVDGNY